MPGTNSYPNPDNYPAPSFPTPVPPPEVDPDAGELLYVGYNPAWTEVIEGALMQLMNPATWQGDHDDIITAQNRANVLMWLLQEPVDVGEVKAPTPYWDEDSDVPDEFPADVQPWYGYVTNPEAPQDELDFVEQFSIWAMTGFLAVATWEIGAAPAILFHTIAPRFVLAMRRGDLGEVIRILVDGEEQARVDTSSYAPGDVIRQSIFTDDSLAGHDIAIVQVS